MSPELHTWILASLKAERKRLDGFLALGNEIERAKQYDAWIIELSVPTKEAILHDLLEDAYTGLKWYREMHPEDDSQMDDELYARIEAALAR